MRLTTEGSGSPLGARDSAAAGVAHPKLKRPVLRPFFFLLVLADLEQNRVRALMIFLAAVDQFSVEPELDGVRATDMDPHRLGSRRVQFCCGIGNGPHV